jgi:hypothetical protein
MLCMSPQLPIRRYFFPHAHILITPSLPRRSSPSPSTSPSRAVKHLSPPLTFQPQRTLEHIGAVNVEIQLNNIAAGFMTPAVSRYDNVLYLSWPLGRLRELQPFAPAAWFRV